MGSTGMILVSGNLVSIAENGFSVNIYLRKGRAVFAFIIILFYIRIMSTENQDKRLVSTESCNVIRPKTRAALLEAIHTRVNEMASEFGTHIQELSHAPIDDVIDELSGYLHEAIRCLHRDVDHAFMEVPLHVEVGPSILPGAISRREAIFKKRQHAMKCEDVRALILKRSSFSNMEIPPPLAEALTVAIVEESVDIRDRLMKHVVV